MEKGAVWQSIKDQEKDYLDLLFTLLKQPSISSQQIGVEECAELLKSMMEESGIQTQVIDTDGLPVVYGEVIEPENDFTLLIYGHYDVQPPEPLNKSASALLTPDKLKQELTVAVFATGNSCLRPRGGRR